MPISNSLMIKYGLSRQPTDSEIARWVSETERLVTVGYSNEDAGRRAAHAVLPGAGSRGYKTQADTISALLAEAKKRR